LDALFAYDKENIPDTVIQKIEPYINNDKFTPAAIAQVNILLLNNVL
jgi:dynein heavy chain